MTIAVLTYFNTEPDGSPVADSKKFDDADYPKAYHGPFDTMADAIHFMNEVWPDGDTDIADQIADDFPDLDPAVLNDPASLTGPLTVPEWFGKKEAT